MERKQYRTKFLSFIRTCAILLIVGIYYNENPILNLVNTPLYQEFSFPVGEKNPLEGILTLPKDVENPKVVLLVQGSGSSDKNAQIFLNKPFEDIAYGLAESGIATLRYDKRFFTYPKLAITLGVDMTLEDEILNDVNTALNSLNSDTRVGDIFVLGHSLGGMLTPAIATQNDFVQGIISMAGSPSPLYEISYQQNKATQAEVEINPLSDDEMLDFNEEMAQVEKDIEILRGDMSNISNDTILLGLPAGYQKSVKQYAGENYLDELNIPMLILQGDSDFQVSHLIDFELYKDILSTRDNVTFILYEGLNHLMMPTTGIQDISDYLTQNNVSADVINDISNFLH